MKKILLLIVFIVVQAYACRVPIATTSVYFLPDAKALCGSYGVKCKAFLKEVKMQGSGKLYASKIYRYTGKIEDLGDCTTTRGASGECQIPYISVAADARYFNMGDVIEMKGLKGKKMTRRDGSTFIHPGYLLVHDTGGAIDGVGRFDMFSDVGLMNTKNAFGYKAEVDLKLYHTDTCTSLKTFKRLTPKSPGFKAAINEINKAVGTHIDEPTDSPSTTGTSGKGSN